MSATTGEELSDSSSLTLGREYVVLEVMASPGSRVSLRILSDDDEVPVLWETHLFTTSRGEMPSSWSAVIDADGVLFIRPDAWHRPGFWEDYFDGHSDAIAAFEEAKALVFAEDEVSPPPHRRPVFNLTGAGLHSYYAGRPALPVHDSNWPPPKDPPPGIPGLRKVKAKTPSQGDERGQRQGELDPGERRNPATGPAGAMAQWFLEVYNRTGDEFIVSEHLLRGVDTEEVRAVIGEPADNPMYEVWVLPEAHHRWAERAAGVTLDTDRFEYRLSGKFESPGLNVCRPNGLTGLRLPTDAHGRDLTQWFLEVYDRSDDEFVSDHLLHGVETDEMRRIAAETPGNSRPGVFVLPDSLHGWAERASGVALDTGRFEYQLIGKFVRPGDDRSRALPEPDLVFCPGVIVEWSLVVYDRANHEPVGDHLLHGVDTGDIRRIAAESPPLPDADAFVLPDSRHGWAERAAGVALDTARFEYRIIGKVAGPGDDRPTAALPEPELVLVGWFLEVIDRADGAVVAEHLLDGVDTDEVGAILGEAADEYDLHDLPDGHRGWAERAAGVILDTDRFEYQLFAKHERPGFEP